MLHTVNVNGKRVDIDNICDTLITPYQQVDSALKWIIENHPELNEHKDIVKAIILEWQTDEILMNMD